MSNRNYKIAGLVKDQFPEFYQEEGQVFIDFVTAYYDWLESKTYQRNVLIAPRRQFVSVAYGSANVVGANTKFLSSFSNGDKIAITKNDTNYEIFTIDVVSNNTFLTLTDSKLPDFAERNTTYGNVASLSNPGYYVRRTPDIMDVDSTPEEFVVWFKEMYLKNIQFETTTNTRTLIKHALDLYRSKGTPRSVDLLFKIAYGVPAKVYYPSRDLMNTSQGVWHQPKYLELAPSDQAIKMENKQITGLTSGATAFVDAIVRKNVKGKLLDIAYISAINGNFVTNELVNPLDESIPTNKSPLVVGSLNEVIVVSGGQSWNVGDLVEMTSNSGEQALGRVANVETQTGKVSVTLSEGGYAYSANAEVFISENIVTLQDLQVNTAADSYFEDFEHVQQPHANIIYESATATPVVGDVISTYHANGDLKGSGEVLAITSVNNTYGELKATILTGDLDGTTYYTVANAENFTKNTFTDTTATGNVVGYYANVELKLTNVVGTFTNNEIIEQTNTAGGGFVGRVFDRSGSNATMLVESSNGVFNPNWGIVGANSGATANISQIDVQIGIKDVSGTWITLANNYVTGNTSRNNVNATASFVSAGAGMTFAVANNLLYPEFVLLNTDYISTNATHYLAQDLAAASWGFPGDTNANLTSNTIENILTYANTEIGKIQTLTGINPGDNYNAIPIVRIYEALTAPYSRFSEKVVEISGATGSFIVGEIVEQEDNEFRGRVDFANSSCLKVQRLRFNEENDIVLTTNSTTTIVGESSGAEANVESVSSNSATRFIGDNAEVDLDLADANGVITKIDVTDSGLGFVHGETVNWESNNRFGTGVANLYTYGTGRGFYKNKDSFLSNKNKLQDGEYWQTHSYEVRSSVDINKYRDMLESVVHVAGLGLFGNLVYSSVSDFATTFANSGESTISNFSYIDPPVDLFANGENGVWLDISNTASLFQERTGASATTPANVGDPVGTILDQSGRGNHATANSDASRGILRQDANNKYYIETTGNTGYEFAQNFTNSTVFSIGMQTDDVAGMWFSNGYTTTGSSGYSTALNSNTTKIRASISSNVTVSPSGESDADKLVCDGTAAESHLLQKNHTVSSATEYTYSIYAKKDELDFVVIYNSSETKGKYFDLTNGTVGSDFVSSPSEANIVDVGNGWFRCSITFTSSGTAANIFIYLAEANNDAIFDGDSTSGIYLWQSQLESGSVATSPLPYIFVFDENNNSAIITGGVGIHYNLDISGNTYVYEDLTRETLAAIVNDGNNHVLTLSNTIPSDWTDPVMLGWGADNHRLRIDGKIYNVLVCEETTSNTVQDVKKLVADKTGIAVR